MFINEGTILTMVVIVPLVAFLPFVLSYSFAGPIHSSLKHDAATSGETFKILAVAGQLNKDQNLTSDVELIDPFKVNSNCAKPADYPLKTSEITGSGGIVCGGSFENIYNKCFQYSNKNKSWGDIGSLNDQYRYAASSVFLNGKYWISGGGLLNGRTSLITSEIFPDNHGAFSMSADLPEQWRHHCMSKVNDTHIFVAGGDWSSKNAYLVDVSLDKFKFVKLPPMLESRSGAACGTIVWLYSSFTRTNDFLVIVAGGRDGFGITDTSKTSEFYSPLANVWVNGPSLPRGFANGGYFTTGHYSLIMVGGLDEHGNQRSDVMAFQHVQSWIEFLPGKLITPRYSFTAIEIQTNEEC